jgi:hypothetical protein
MGCAVKTYNAQNRPVRWERGSSVVIMDFDRMGRRVEFWYRWNSF